MLFNTRNKRNEGSLSGKVSPSDSLSFVCAFMEMKINNDVNEEVTVSTNEI